MNIVDFCNECGNCTTFCPTSGAPYRDKPRICLSEDTFALEDNAYLLDGNAIKWRKDGSIETLTRMEDHLIYETESIWARLEKENFALVEMRIKKDNRKSPDFTRAAHMYFLLHSLGDTYIFSDVH